MGDSLVLPPREEDIQTLLNVFLVEKAVYELDYELIDRPDWILIPGKGIREVISAHLKP